MGGLHLKRSAYLIWIIFTKAYLIQIMKDICDFLKFWTRGILKNIYHIQTSEVIKIL